MSRFPGSLALVHSFALSGCKLVTTARNTGLCVLGCVAILGSSALRQSATTTTLAITSNGSAATTVPFGTVITLTATVAAGPTPVSPGQVNFCDATAAHCEDIHIIGTAQLTSAGTATFKFRPGVGSHSYNAVFLGTPSSSPARAGSTSGNVALTVTAPAQYPSVTVMSVAGSTGSYQLGAAVSGIGSVPPSGAVLFLDTSNGNAQLGTASLSSASSSFGLANVSNPATGPAPLSIAVADFNLDGIPDMAIANGGSGLGNDTLTILLGKGDGTFTAAASPATSVEPEVLVAGDFNGDGIPDLAVGGGGFTLNVLLGNGDGTFRTATVPPFQIDASALAVGDFNGDGNLDLAVLSGLGDTFTILLGHGDGTFTEASTSPITVTNIPTSFAVADFNGDGKLDIAIANYASSCNPGPCTFPFLTILLGKGDGTFTASTVSSNSNVFQDSNSVVASDFNGDGVPDLAFVAANSVEVLLGNGDGTFTATATSTPIPGPGDFMAVGDFDGNGIADLAVTYGPPQAAQAYGVVTLIGKGDGTFTSQTYQAATNSLNPDGVLEAIAVGDFNGDGLEDLAAPDLTNNTAMVLLSQTQFDIALPQIPIALSGSGTHLIEASYPGDANYAASTSPTAAFNLYGTPIVNLQGSATTITFGTPVTLTATVTGTGPTPTGSVDFYNGGVGGQLVAGNVPVINGVATTSVPGLPADSNSLSYVLFAAYSGDNNYPAANSAGVSLIVNQATPTIVWPVPSTITYGTQLPYVTVQGNVEGTLSVSPSINVPLNVGTHDVIAQFTPSDTNDYKSVSDTVTVTVTQGTPTVAFVGIISSGSNYYVSVTIGIGTPTGTVSFYDEGALLGTSTIGACICASDLALLHVDTLPPGPTSITAVYNGDSNDLPATSAPFLVSAGKTTPTINWSTPSAITYGTALSATQLNATSSVAGAFAYSPAAGTVLGEGSQTLSVTFTPTDTTDYTTATAMVSLTVSQAAPATTWAPPAPITFGTALSATQLDATSTVPGSFVYTPAAGTALSAGLHTLSVTFTPTDTTDYTTSTATVPLTVTQAAPTVTWAAPAEITYGTALSASQLNAASTVAGAFVYTPAAGTVLSAGAQTLSATFTPTDTTDYASATSTVMLTVGKATPTIALATSATSTFVLNPVIFTATVASTAGSPTGTVAFYDGMTLLGTESMTVGVATYQTSALLAGTHSITAIYSGDTNFAAGTSSALSQVIENFTVDASGGTSSVTANPGGQAVYTFTVTPPTGTTFADPISFSVTGLPTGATAVFAPTTVPAGAGTTTVTMTVTLPASAALRPSERPFPGGSLPVVALGILLLPFTGRLRRTARGLKRTVCLLIIGLALASGITACGGGGGGGGGSGSSSTPENYILTVTATAGSLSNTFAVGLVVE